jgi:hypothetical protein
MITIALAPDKLTKTGAAAGAPLPDRASAVWDGTTYTARTSHGAAMAVARTLMAAGCPDQPWQAVSPDGERLLHGGSLHRLANLTVSEADGRTRIVPYVPDRRFPVEQADQDGVQPLDQVAVADPT